MHAEVSRPGKRSNMFILIFQTGPGFEGPTKPEEGRKAGRWDR